MFNSDGIKTETIAYEDSLKNGNHIYWHLNGKKHKQFRYGNNILNGKYEEWDSLGTDIVRGFYSEGRRHKYVYIEMDSVITDYLFEYYPNWQIKKEPDFNDKGLYHGKWESYYESGEIKKKYAFELHQKNGVWLSFHEDNRRNNYTYYSLDSLVTNYEFTYFENLQIKEEPSFNKGGLYDGKWETFFAHGKTHKTFYYAESIKTNIWTVYWDSTFHKQSETSYENDLKHGPNFAWYSNSNPMSEGTYKEGKKDLLWTYWNEFGERRFEEWREGELYDTFEFEYYPNGQVKEEPSYENGKKHGEWVRYFQDGTIRGTSAYKDGLKDGWWIDYYRPEQVAFQGKYVADVKQGEWEWYWLNHTLMSKVIYKDGDITFEECYDRSSGNTRDCSKVFSPDDIYYKTN
ncbi:MAG: hypothetical protein U9N31_09530 [Candidatus Marinimicrobia bacterium]|nr:hypothetical protein [Candidatus Neomarinimicrobiota bacterium]